MSGTRPRALGSHRQKTPDGRVPLLRCEGVKYSLANSFKIRLPLEVADRHDKITEATLNTARWDIVVDSKKSIATVRDRLPGLLEVLQDETREGANAIGLLIHDRLVRRPPGPKSVPCPL